MQAYAQQVMTAALARCAGSDRIFLGADFLAQAGKGVIFSQKADHRMALAPGGPDGGGETGIAHFHCEALLTQIIGQPLAGVDFVVGGFGSFPDLLSQFGQFLSGLIHSTGGSDVQHKSSSPFLVGG